MAWHVNTDRTRCLGKYHLFALKVLNLNENPRQPILPKFTFIEQLEHERVVGVVYYDSWLTSQFENVVFYRAVLPMSHYGQHMTSQYEKYMVAQLSHDVWNLS